MNPTLTERPQYEVALEQANEIRMAMAAQLRELRALPSREGLVRAAELLEHPDEITARLELRALLKAVKRMGPARMHRLVVPFGHAAVLTRRIGPLEVRPQSARVMSKGQRAAIACSLRRLAEAAY